MRDIRSALAAAGQVEICVVGGREIFDMFLPQTIALPDRLS
jgi:hypothetical protein